MGFFDLLVSCGSRLKSEQSVFEVRFLRPVII